MRFFLLIIIFIAWVGTHLTPAHADVTRRMSRSVTKEASGSFTVAALDDDLLCLWIEQSGTVAPARIVGSIYRSAQRNWSKPRILIAELDAVHGLSLLQTRRALLLLTVDRAPGSNTTSYRVVLRCSVDLGATWSGPEILYEHGSSLLLGEATVLSDGTVVVGLAERSQKPTNFIRVLRGQLGQTWTAEVVTTSTRDDLSRPVLLASGDEDLAVYLKQADVPHRYLRSAATNGGSWSKPEPVNLPIAASNDAPPSTCALLSLSDGRVLAIANDNVLRPGELSARFSYDGGRQWPVRRVIDHAASTATPCLVQTKNRRLHAVYRRARTVIEHAEFTENWALSLTRLEVRPQLANVAPPARSSGRRSGLGDTDSALPIRDETYLAHVQVPCRIADWRQVNAIVPSTTAPGVSHKITTPLVRQGGREWVGTDRGLYSRAATSSQTFQLHPTYGVDGPAANVIADIAVDSKDILWVATPAGLSARDTSGGWRSIRGREGLPWEKLTSIAIDRDDRLWLGSTRGLMQYRPDAKGRQWYYRAGARYLPADEILDVAVSDDGRTVHALTTAGIGCIEDTPRTLYGKAEYLEAQLNLSHRRLGMPSPGGGGPQASDGLWTGYHVAAMSLAYSLTLDERYRTSAKQSMGALYLLQNVTGIRGLVARTVVATKQPDITGSAGPNWHATADGRYLWHDDISSDQIDGHFLAFYSYFEHIAQFDPVERRRIESQVRQVIDYILAHDYQVIDEDGERTKWGWWSPQLLNNEPENYLESGLYSLMLLSFLKTAYYITDDARYAMHSRKLIERHGYLSNLLLEKKLFPDELNHSDDQLAAVAYYPILQLEHNPFIRDVLRRAARRHAIVEEPERNSFFAFVYGSIDPTLADVAGGVQTLREMPQDRHGWTMQNSHRADIVFDPRSNRFGRVALLEVLPYDEHHFDRWNQDPYAVDVGGGEGTGVHYLLPYWIGRYHGLISAPR